MHVHVLNQDWDHLQYFLVDRKVIFSVMNLEASSVDHTIREGR